MARFSSDQEMHVAARLLHGVDLTLVPMAPPQPAGLPDADDSMAPGWYDSSWDLRRGLEVREAVLPSEWFNLFLQR